MGVGRSMWVGRVVAAGFAESPGGESLVSTLPDGSADDDAVGGGLDDEAAEAD